MRTSLQYLLLQVPPRLYGYAIGFGNPPGIKEEPEDLLFQEELQHDVVPPAPASPPRAGLGGGTRSRRTADSCRCCDPAGLETASADAARRRQTKRQM